MSILCLDIGNTTAHLGLLKDGVPARERRHPTEGLPRNLPSILEDYPDASRFAYCSVVPAINLAIAEAVEAANLELFNLNADTCPIAIDYPNKTEIGQDRLANAIAAAAHGKMPAIVIDMGTATTFDIVTEENGYEGGVITAGLSLMREYLHEKTALLPQVSYCEIPYPNTAIGKSTREAMEIGGVIGYEGMVKEIIAAISRNLYKRHLEKPGIILTGGKAPFLEEILGDDCHYIPQLTLHGLEIACRKS